MKNLKITLVIFV